MGVKKKLFMSFVFTVATVIIGISSIVGADKRHGIAR